MINRKMAALTLAGLMSSCSLFALAGETTKQGSAVPPAAIPGLNQPQGAESNEEKADKIGEEAAGSNSGADSQALEKGAQSSNNSKEDGENQGK